MRVGILSTCQYSMFSGGLANTTIALYETYKILKCDVVLLNTNSSVEWFDDCKGLHKNINVENINRDTDNYENKFDLIIELIPYFQNENQRRMFSKKNIFMYRKNILIPTIYSFWSRKNGNVPLKDIREKLLGLYLRDDIYTIPFDEINL